MTHRCFVATLPLFFLSGMPAFAQDAPLPPGEKEPILRVDGGGPTSFVTALAFSPDGKALYAAGFDKVVRVWRLKGRQFELDTASYRVLMGPGLDGAINTIAVSPDGVWLAAAGMGIVRGGAGYTQPGLLLPEVGALTPEMREDRGLIYVFNTTKSGEVHILRGHRGPVQSMTFAPTQEGQRRLLVAAAREWDDKQNAYVGAVRLWDVEAGKEVFQPLLDLPDPERPKTRPGLAAWYTKEASSQLRVATVWADSKVRVWDVARKGIGPRELREGKENLTVAYLPGQTTLLTSSYVHSDGQRLVGGRLTWWDVRPRQGPQEGRHVIFPTEDNGVFYYPRALALLSSQAGGPLDHAAVVLRTVVAEGREDLMHRQNQCILRLVDLTAKKKIGKPIPLWRSGEKEPVLAAVEGGQYLAVAGGFGGHAIRVYEIADLVANKDNPQNLRPQVLKSAGTTFRYVSFVRRKGDKGERLGLLLSEKAKGEAGQPPRGALSGDLLFDFSQRSLTADTVGWDTDAPSVAGWEARYTPARKNAQGAIQPPVIEVRQKGQRVRQIKPKTEPMNDVNELAVYDFALLPPRPPQPALLAVALRDIDEHRVVLYNAETGDKLRHYTGHTDRIRALAFSKDGRLLASVADDQTVCVWSLTQLDAILGEWGMLPGVTLEPDQKRQGVPVVHSIEAGGPAQGKLRLGDWIMGIVKEGKVQNLVSPRAVYDAIKRMKPGTEVVLRVRDRQGQGRDVRLTVGQAADDRKPLVSLFVTRKAPGQYEWVGWNPYGPYEASDREAERLIGWHFNTGNPQAPVSFALADQYRKGRYREGILQHLVAQGSLSPALKAWEEEENRKILPAPNMTLEIDDLGPEPKKDRHGHIVLTEAPGKLTLAIDNGVPDDRLAAVQWQVDGGALREFTERTEQGREAVLSQLAWTRGIHKIRVVVRTRETVPQEYTQELTLRYQPPPILNFDPRWLKKHFGEAPPRPLIVRDQPKFLIEAEARPGLPDQDIKVSLLHDQKPPELLGRKIKKEIELHEGDNLIELKVEYLNPLRDYEEFEVTRKTLRITYVPAEVKTPPPQISVEDIRLVESDKPLAVEPGKPLSVTSSPVHIRGKITAEAILTEAKRDNQALAKFQGNTTKQFPFDEVVNLKLGKQQINFLAKTAQSEEAKVSVTVIYQPPLPKVALTPPAQGRVFYDAGQGPPAIELKGRLFDQPKDSPPYKAVLLRNGVELADPPTLDKANQQLTAKVALQPGDNRIQVKLTNDYAVEFSEVLNLRYLRPPHKIVLDDPKLGGKALTDIVARVESSLPLLADSVQATINGRPIPTSQLTPLQPPSQTWKVLLKDVPLDAGANEVRLWVSNAEAQCQQPGSLKFVYNAPKVPSSAPRVAILSPVQDINVTDPAQRLRFRVWSTGRLQRVELVREGLAEFRLPFQVDQLTKNDEGLFELKVDVRLTAQDNPQRVNPAVDVSKAKTNAEGFYDVAWDLRLLPRENRFRVEAVNEGGVRQALVVINYLHMPVRLVFEELRGKQGNVSLKPKVRPGGTVSFDPAPEGPVLLRGKVLWDNESDEKLKQVNWVRVYVNGFQQIPARLDKPIGAARERTFTASILLNRSTKNEVEVELPNDQQEASNRPRFTVDCTHPVKEQRLHLLIVGVGEQDEQKLIEHANQALRTRAFTEIIRYGPLTGYVSQRQVFLQLRHLRHRIDLDAQRGAANDVVMVYYHGKETMAAEGHYFLTSDSKYDPEYNRSAVTCAGLAELFGQTLGAQVLLLDVERAPGQPANAKDAVKRWPEEVRTGVFRAAWLDPSKVPEKARLIYAWEQASPKVSLLGEVNKQVTDEFTQVAKKYSDKQFAYDGHIPTSLRELVVGGRTVAGAP
jgi:WD40 repeat protein